MCLQPYSQAMLSDAMPVITKRCMHCWSAMKNIEIWIIILLLPTPASCLLLVTCNVRNQNCCFSQTGRCVCPQRHISSSARSRSPPPGRCPGLALLWLQNICIQSGETGHRGTDKTSAAGEAETGIGYEILSSVLQDHHTKEKVRGQLTAYSLLAV